MPWVRRDDQASIHRKVAPLDDATYRLWSEAIEWCSRNGTDGRIGASELSEIKRGTQARAGKLVERTLWHQAGHVCDSEHCPPSGPDGWVIHDYLDYNPSKAQVMAELKAKAERTRRWRARKAGDGTGDAYVTDHIANGDASRDAPVTLPRPVPPRPAPKEGGGGAPAVTAAARPAHGAGDGGPAKDPNPAVPHPPSSNSPAPAKPPADLLQQTRNRLRDAAAKTRAAGERRERRGLAELRAATADVPVPVEPAPSTPDPKESP